MNRLLTSISGLAVAIGSGWVVWRSGFFTRKGSKAALPSFDEGETFKPESVSVSAAARASHKWARPIVMQALNSVLGRGAELWEAQYGQAIGWVESNYGKGWTKCPAGCQGDCDIAGAQASNNWGAVQAKGGEAGFQWCDSHPDGKTYKQRFRSYPTPVLGAADMLGHVFSKRPLVSKALSTSGATVYRASLAMRRAVYYGGFCPKAVARYGSSIAIPSYREPDRDEGTRACEREAVELHAKRVFDTIKAIAASNGDTSILPLGTFDDAYAWYQKEKSKS